MALFYNLKTLEEHSCNDAKKFIDMLYYHWNKAAPLKRSNMDKRSRVSLTGHSFLLNPLAFFEDTSTDTAYRVQYIKLAGMRDYGLYRQYKYKRLQTSFFPDLAFDMIKHNPLLVITPTEIIFKYEES
jgi:hypothetical protein